MLSSTSSEASSSGQSPVLRSGFDPAHWHVVAADQRGSGGSTPRGGTAANTLAHVLADLRLLHRHLGEPRWPVVGGSWGATLAVAHAADQPQAVSGLLLRASYLGRDEDLAAFLSPPSGSDPAGQAAWAALLQGAGLPAGPAGPATPAPTTLLAALAERLHGLEPAAQQAAAHGWWLWERWQSGQPPDAEAPQGEALPAQVDRLRVQSHYLLQGCFLQPSLLARLPPLPRVPVLLLHADNDRICPPDGARALLAGLHAAGHAEAQLHWVPGAGHDPAHPAMAGAQRAALAHFARHGRWPDRAA